MEGAGVQCLRSFPTKDSGRRLRPKPGRRREAGAEVRRQVTIRREGQVQSCGHRGCASSSSIQSFSQPDQVAATVPMTGVDLKFGFR